MASVLNFWACRVASNVGWIIEEPAGRVIPSARNTSTDLDIPVTDSREKSFGHLVREHHQYLRRLAEEGLISRSLSELGMAIWWRLSNAVEGDLAVPDAAPSSDEGLLYIWERGGHYLSLEMSEEGAEFFYRNRMTGDIWGADFDPQNQNIPEVIVAKLKLFLGYW